MRRTKEQAAETARQIRRAAEELFLDRGYDNVSLEQVAIAAGVTRGAVHWHFKNKQGLLLALQEDAQIPFQNLADRLSDRADPAALSVLGELISELFARFEAEPRQKGVIRVLQRLDINLTDQGAGGGSTFREDTIVIFRRIFQAVDKGAGLPTPWTADVAASTLCATISGLIEEWALGKTDFRLAPDGQNLVRTLLKAWKL
ncbi:HTH tetR-type domain-containing protein [Hyphomicrobiales bacterium]|nr:TetR family transcriptional regulator [Bosea sp. (in: a-proteobacteria)]CAH1696423.1 HTH tetR-type domain-containing protein [Hyphomicrobiales bacterium]CAH1696494.1 TetR/AcrR family transcriptional regulator [Hyphomicrobiales bacterium]